MIHGVDKIHSRLKKLIFRCFIIYFYLSSQIKINWFKSVIFLKKSFDLNRDLNQWFKSLDLNRANPAVFIVRLFQFPKKIVQNHLKNVFIHFSGRGESLRWISAAKHPRGETVSRRNCSRRNCSRRNCLAAKLPCGETVSGETARGKTVHGETVRGETVRGETV